MVILNSDNCPPLNSSVTNIVIIILLLVVNHGYEPQSKYWKYFAASCLVSYPPHKRDNSTNASNFTSFVLPRRYAPGIILPASFSTLCF